MGMSTRSKSNSAPPSVPLIAKSRKSKAKKGTTVPNATPSLSVGSKLPALSIYTDEGKLLRSGEDICPLDKKGAVLFLYPRANTPGCTTQACAFRDRYADVEKAGYVVWGVSYDKVKSQAGWRAKHGLPYGLLCDTLEVGLVKMVGAHKAPKGVKRSVVVLKRGADGLEVGYLGIGVSPKESVPVAMKVIAGGEEGVEDGKGE